jgi:two-component system response regulator PilR (NtrC family)
MNQILIVDDEQSMLDFLTLMLQKEGYDIITANDGAKAKEFIKKEKLDLIISDIKMPDIDGIELLKYIKEINPGATVILITAYASTKTAIQALKLGAYDYISKPFDIDELKIIIEKALEKKRLTEEVSYLKRELAEKHSFANIIGKSKKMKELFQIIEKVASSNATVLIAGESGTGKELVAQAIHYNSPRQNKRFVSVNCGALPPDLLESELFGYMKGAFTGAVRNKEGLFEVAHDGTILLDEISEMSPQMQVKLLRVLQERNIRRLGGTEEIRVDVRVIASTNRDLQKHVLSGAFREDLFYRINVIQIKIPPLRERKADILPLVEHFLQKYCKEMGKDINSMNDEARNCLLTYHWPGNVRELENAIEAAVALTSEKIITVDKLPQSINKSHKVVDDSQFRLRNNEFDLEEHLDQLRKQFIISALQNAEGVQRKAAELLHMSSRSFRYFVKKFNLR